MSAFRSFDRYGVASFAASKAAVVGLTGNSRHTVLVLANDAASYVTGQTRTVDGGWTAF